MTDILEKFHKFNARVVFSAEGFCWPDKTLAVSLGSDKEYAGVIKFFSQPLVQDKWPV